MRNRFLPLLLLACLATVESSSTPDGKVETTLFKGQLMLLADKSVFDSSKPDTYYFNFGGPALRVTRKSVSAALTFAPSMRIQFVDQSVKFAPVLGFGGEISHRQVILGLTEYYNSKNGNWELAVGIGFRLK